VNIAPTTSTTMMLALGDALAVAVMRARGFTRERFRLLHPGGTIGSRLVSVEQIMNGPERLPLVPLDMPMQDVVVEMTEKSFGIAGVVDGAGRLVGVITDGDLRRHSATLFASTAGQVMTCEPKTIPEGSLAEDAMAVMQAHLITALFVMAHDDPHRPVGLLHVHDMNRYLRI
jgi:arabinose-5-phosphate isomerase